MKWVVLVAVLGCNAPSSADNKPSPPAVVQPYPTIRSKLETSRTSLTKGLDRDRQRTLSRARQLLVRTLRDELLPAWNGTPWAMNGITQVPHEGEIACGYFVSTTLLHAGFAVERSKLGQQAAGLITRTLVTQEPIWVRSDQPIDAFVDTLRLGGDGIYLVGLDNHVGFVIVDGEDTWFHHAGPGDQGVRREPARTASFLSTSRYREAAKLFDDALLEKWLRGTAIPTVLRRNVATPTER
ncbi:MAG: hypothetical protein ACKV2T_21405 [Kofleriaceae bacterium]